MVEYVKRSSLGRNIKIAFSLITLFILTFFGFKQESSERHAYDVFSVGVAHAEVPGGGACDSSCAGCGATSSSSCSSAAGCDADAGTGDGSGGAGCGSY